MCMFQNVLFSKRGASFELERKTKKLEPFRESSEITRSNENAEEIGREKATTAMRWDAECVTEKWCMKIVLRGRVVA